MALPTPTLWPTITSFNFLFILPTGNRRPALDDLVLPPPTAALALPSFALAVLTVGSLAGLLAFGLCEFMLSREPVLARAALSFLFYLLWIGKWMGAGGGGGLLSKRVSGTREAASSMDLLLKASLPILSRVSRMLREGSKLNTWAR